MWLDISLHFRFLVVSVQKKKKVRTQHTEAEMIKNIQSVKQEHELQVGLGQNL